MRVVSVGSNYELSDLISADGGGSLLTWSTRLSTLNAPVKMHTMDGFLDSLLAKYNHVLHKYEMPKSRDWALDFYNQSSGRFETLKNNANEMID